MVQFRLAMVTRTGIRTPACAHEKLNPKVSSARYAKSYGTWRGPDSLSESAKQKRARKVLLFALVTRTGDRNPRFARGKLRQKNRNERLACSLQGSHTEPDNQKQSMLNFGST